MNTFQPELGYLWHAGEKGCFSPNVGRVEYTKEQAEAHNAQLAELEKAAMAEHGRAVLYLTKDTKGEWKVSNFDGSLSFRPFRVKKGSHNWGVERFDAWFTSGGYVWHGVNVGDNELLRARRTKQPA